MARDRKLKITVPEPLVDDVRGMSPFEGAGAVATKVVSVSADKVRKEIRQTLTSLKDLLADVPAIGKDYDLKEVTFTLGLEASGSVSLLSVASGNVSGSSGLQFTFRRIDAE